MVVVVVVLLLLDLIGMTTLWRLQSELHTAAAGAAAAAAVPGLQRMQALPAPSLDAFHVGCHSLFNTVSIYYKEDSFLGVFCFAFSFSLSFAVYIDNMKMEALHVLASLRHAMCHVPCSRDDEFFGSVDIGPGRDCIRHPPDYPVNERCLRTHVQMGVDGCGCTWSLA